MDDGNLPVLILLTAHSLHEIRVHEPHLIARIKPLVFGDRGLHKVVPLDIELSSERDLTFQKVRIFKVVVRVEHLRLSFRIIVDHELDRVEDSHHAGDFHFQIVTDAVLEHRVIDRGIRLGNADKLNESLDRLGRKSPAAKRSDRDKARVIPAVDDPVLDKLFDIALACDDIGQIHLCELDLLRRMLPLGVFNDPLIERTVILELKRADGVGNAFDRVLDRMSEVIHRINAPAVTGVVMRKARDPVNDRISHIDIGRGHVDLRAEDLGTVGVLPVFHFRKELQVLLNAPVPVGAVPAGLLERSSVLADLFRREVAHKGQSLFDQKNCLLVHDLKIVGSKVKVLAEIRAEPQNIFLNGIDKFRPLLGRICVIETEIELSSVFFCQAVIQKNRLCVSDMQVTVRFRRKAGADLFVLPLCQIRIDDLLNEISRDDLFFLFSRILYCLTHNIPPHFVHLIIRDIQLKRFIFLNRCTHFPINSLNQL